MLGKFACELCQVRARFDELRHPIEACCGIALAKRLHDVGQIAGIHAAEHALGNGQGDLALAERDGLLKRGERVSHATASVMGDQVERIAFEFHTLGHAHRAQARDDGLVGYAAEIEALATRMDGLRHLLRIGGCQDEHHVIGRFLQRLEQRVERCDGQHMDLVDDIDLVAAARGCELHAVDDLLAHVLHARAACRVELVDVGVHALGDHLAILAGAVRVGRGALLAQQRLGKQARRGGLARAARAAEQVGVADLILLDGVFDGALDLLLTHHVLEDLRTVFAVQRLCHVVAPCPACGYAKARETRALWSANIIRASCCGRAPDAAEHEKRPEPASPGRITAHPATDAPPKIPANRRECRATPSSYGRSGPPSPRR